MIQNIVVALLETHVTAAKADMCSGRHTDGVRNFYVFWGGDVRATGAGSRDNC